MLAALPCPPVKADEDATSVDLVVEVVSPPSVVTLYACPVTAKSALLRGRLESLGTASSVSVYFEWGTTTDYGHRTRAHTLRRPRRFSAPITGLTPNTTYHFRAVAVGDAIHYGSDMRFRTRKHWHWWCWWWYCR